jgi:hypothetical protein
VLDGFHRIVLTPIGWLHEQHAWKRVAVEAAGAAAAPVFLAAEIGLDRYERITAPVREPHPSIPKKRLNAILGPNFISEMIRSVHA